MAPPRDTLTAATSDTRHTGPLMHTLQQLLENNQAWAERMRRQDPEFFTALARGQTPRYLWIGCGDSRVPPNEILGLGPGELFVHRNIANLVVHTDLNALAAIQFAVDVLKVGDVIVCGHYGCGGVGAAFRQQRIGLCDHWLSHIEDIRQRHQARLADAPGPAEAADRLCEINVIEQVLNLCHTPVVRDAWGRGQPLAVHGWIYGLKDGLVRDLDVTVTSPENCDPVYRAALASLP